MDKKGMADACLVVYQGLVSLEGHVQSKQWIEERKQQVAELMSIVKFEMISDEVPVRMVRILFEINEEVNEAHSEMGYDDSE